jgi:hypothetical protein
MDELLELKKTLTKQNLEPKEENDHVLIPEEFEKDED